MAKKKKEEPKRELTKRQLSRWQQQKRRQRIILIVGIAAIASALGIFGGNWYVSSYQPLHQIAIEVNDQQFDMDYYVKMLQVYGEDTPVEFLPYYTDQVVADIQQNALIVQEAEKLGFTVSDDEVDEALVDQGFPLEEHYRDVLRTQLLINKLYEEYIENEVPLSAEQRYIMTMLLESESQVEEIRARLENSEAFGDLAAELSLEDYTKTNGGDFGWMPEGVLTLVLDNPIPEEVAFSLEQGEVSQAVYDEEIPKSVGYWLVRVVERDDELREAHIEVILLGSKGEADEVRARLEAGEDFNALAEEVSQDAASQSSGGDLNWLVSSETAEETDTEEEELFGELPSVNPVLEEFVFSSEVGTLSEPIRDDAAQTTGGYWLVKVLSIDDNKEIDIYSRDLLKSDVLEKWIDGLWDNPDNKLESYLDDEMKAWALAQL
ncbi:peptidylprolyl isomerase [Chloroflexota bacterium]